MHANISCHFQREIIFILNVSESLPKSGFLFKKQFFPEVAAVAPCERREKLLLKESPGQDYLSWKDIYSSLESWSNNL